MTGLVALEPTVLIPPPVGRQVPSWPEGGEVVRLGGDTMGTGWQLSVVVDGAAQIEAAEAAVARGLAMVIGQMSQWEPDSEISRFNAAPAGTAFNISPAFAKVLDCALTIARASGGAFDPTLGAVSDRWGFGPSDRVSTDERAKREAEWRALSFDPSTHRIVQPGGVQLDLSGIAKGFAVDLVSLLLERAGLVHHLVEIGGELRGSGLKPDAQPWWVDLEPVPDAEPDPVRIALSGWSVATSGDWHRRRVADGKSWSHTLCPERLAPVENRTRAATVLHCDCMQADALATVMMVLSPDAALAFAQGHGIAARIVAAEGAALTSPAWQAMS